MTATVVTANRLLDGAVVYMAPEGRWTECLETAQVADGDEGDALLAIAERAVADRLVVTPYLIDVETDALGIRPRHIKEVIRRAGPTVRTDLGKQADTLCAAQ